MNEECTVLYVQSRADREDTDAAGLADMMRPVAL